MIKKRASRNDDKWQGMIGERVDNLVKAVDGLKIATEKGFATVDTKFVDLTKCVNSKFDKHNLHHEHQDKKYIKWFLIIGALALGSLVSNPNGLKYTLVAIKFVVGVF